MKTSELSGTALDWAVAKSENEDEFLFDPHPYLPDENGQPEYFTPSTDWSQGGPIIDRENISVWARGNEWAAETFTPNHRGDEQEGSSPLIAAMRCYVASKLGDEVDIPEELL